MTKNQNNTTEKDFVFVPGNGTRGMQGQNLIGALTMAPTFSPKSKAKNKEDESEFVEHSMFAGFIMSALGLPPVAHLAVEGVLAGMELSRQYNLDPESINALTMNSENIMDPFRAPKIEDTSIYKQEEGSSWSNKMQQEKEKVARSSASIGTVTAVSLTRKAKPTM